MRAALCGSGTTCVRAERGARLVALRGLRQVCPVKFANLHYVVWRALYCLEKPSMVPSRRRTSLADLGTEQLAALAAVTGMTAELPRMQEIFTELLGMSASRTATTPAYPSDVVDDHTPYELSIALGGAAPELRMLVEPAHGDYSLTGRWHAARGASAWLRRAHEADLLPRARGVAHVRTGRAGVPQVHAAPQNCARHRSRP